MKFESFKIANSFFYFLYSFIGIKAIKATFVRIRLKFNKPILLKGYFVICIFIPLCIPYCPKYYGS